MLAVIAGLGWLYLARGGDWRGLVMAGPAGSHTCSSTTAPPVPPRAGAAAALYHRNLVEAGIAVDVPPAPGEVRRTTVHPDIPFALRLSARPGPPEHDSTRA